MSRHLGTVYSKDTRVDTMPGAAPDPISFQVQMQGVVPHPCSMQNHLLARSHLPGVLQYARNETPAQSSTVGTGNRQAALLMASYLYEMVADACWVQSVGHE